MKPTTPEPNSAKTTAEPGRRDLETILSLSLGLAAILVLVKLTLLPFPVTTPVEFLRWVLRLAVVSAADLAFVAGLGGVSAAVSLGLSRRPRAGRIWRFVFPALFQLAALYGIASAAMFRLAMVPLTVKLLSFAGGPVLMASSIAEFLSVGMVAALVAAPVALLAAPWLARRAGLHRCRLRASFVLAGLGLVVAYASISHAYIQREWTDPNRWERRIAYSPHTVFLASCMDTAFRRDPLGLAFHPDHADERDFVGADNAPSGPAGSSGAARVLAGRARPKNVIVVVLESVGTRYLSLYGAAYPTTPNLEQLVQKGGVVCRNVYSHDPSSPNVLVALAASVYPRIDWRLITRDDPDFDVPTLAQVLSARGYRTCYLHSGYWSWKRRDQWLLERGVQTLIDADTMADTKISSWGVSDRNLFRAGLQWIDQDPGRPFHLFFWTIETHHPYIVTGQPVDFGVKDPELNRYLNAIRTADANIAWLVKELATRGLADSTLIAVTGDHGEAFGQHGQRVHSFGVYEENVHVPLVLLYPGLVDARVDKPPMAPVRQQIDLAPTLLDLVGVSAPQAWQGRSVFGPERPRAYFFTVGNEVLIGLREGNLKYHYCVETGREELFDLAADPREMDNLAPRQPERCKVYRNRVGGLVQFQRRFLAEHGAP
ncbi:MAG: LTA synthase family protein [Pirellulales bacterium]